MKFGRKLIALVTVVLMVFGGMPSMAFADPAGPYVCTGFGTQYSVYALDDRHTAAEIYLRNESTNETITTFCADLYHTVSSGTRYTTVSDLTNNSIRAILYATPSALVPGISAADRIKGMQAAIWHFSDNMQLDMDDSRNSANMRALYTALLGLTPMGPVGDTQQAAVTLERTGMSHNGDGTVNISFRYKSSVASVPLTPSVTQGSGDIGPVTDDGEWKAVTVSNIPTDAGFALTVSGQQTIEYDARFLYSPNRQTLAGFPHDEVVTVSGTCSIEFGSLRIRKAFTDPADAGDSAQSFSVTVSGESVSRDADIPGDGSWVTVDGLPYGGYTVTENLTSGQQALYSLEAVTGGGNVTVSATQADVTVTNCQLGSLSIGKDLATSGEPDGTEFGFHISGPGFGAGGEDFTLADGETANFGALPYGEYVISEAHIPGYELTGFTGGGGTYDPSAGTYTLTIGADNRAAAVTANNEKLYGSAVFTKAVDNVENDPAEFTLQVSLDGAPYATVTVSEGAPATLANLPFGTYTVVEDAASEYECVGISPSSFTIDEINHEAAVEVAATNHKKLGTATFVKVVDNVSGDPTDFTLRVTKDGEPYATVTVSEGSSATLTGLPFGSYAVTEDGKAGYATVGISPSSFEIDAETYEEAVTVTATNHKQLGAATFVKVVDNVEDDPAEFTLRVSRNGEPYATVTVSEGSPASLTGLPFGAYEVTEDAAADYDTIGIEPSSFTISAGNFTIPVTVTATNRKQIGSARFTKTIDNDGTDATEFTFDVTGPGGPYVVHASQGTPGILNDLPLGVYTVTERGVTGYGQVSVTPESFTITEENYAARVEVAAVNHKLLGSARFTKQVDNVDNDTTEFTLNIDGDNGYHNTVTVGEMLPAAVLSDLPLGHYTVTEAGSTGYELIGITPGSFDVTAENHTTVAAVTVVNHKMFGSARFRKEVDNVADDPAVFTLRIAGDTGYSNTVTVSETGAAVTLPDLPLGSYTVTEDSADGYENVSISLPAFTLTEENHLVTVEVLATNRKLLGSAEFTKQVDNVDNDTTEFTLTISGDNGYSNTVTVGELLPAAVLNDLPFGHYTVTEAGTTGYELVGITPSEFDVTPENYATVTAVAVVNHELRGSARFTKQVDNVDNDDTEFTLTIEGDNGYSDTVTVGELLPTAVLDDLPFGHYTVTEAGTTGYALVSITPSAFDVTPENVETVTAVAVVNHNTNLGSARFTKQVDNVDNDDTEFTLTIEGDNGYNNTVTVGEMLPAALLSDLPFGHYAVTEAGTTGYELVSITPSEFDVTPGNYATVTAVAVVNHELRGSAEFTKQVDNVDNDATEFTLTIEGDNGYSNTVTVGEMLPAAVLSDLPFGHYTVTEAGTTGYELVGITPSEFDVTPDNYTAVTAVAVVNHELRGSAQFTKQVDNVAGDATEFTLTVSGDNGYSNTVTVGELLPAAVLDDLPFGHYTVTEAGTTGYALIGITPSEFDVTPENVAAVTAVAVVNRKLYGSATFRKAVDNVSGDPSVFRLNIAGPGGYSNHVDVTDEGAAVTLVDLPFGHYTVSEDAMDGYEEVGITPREFDIGEGNYGETPSVSVQAVNRKLYGSAQFTKQVDNVDGDTTEFTLTVTGNNGYSNTVTVGELLPAAVLDDLPLGHYTVTEAGTTGYELVSITPSEFDVTDENYTIVTAVAVVNRGQLGSARFTKQVDNADNDATVFTLAIEGDNGYSNTVTVGELLPEAVLNDLPFGHYTVSEAGTTGYELIGITPSEFDVTPENVETVTAVAVVNRKLLGKAVFVKDVDNVPGDTAEFIFHVQGPDGYHNDVHVTEAGGPVTLDDLPFGHYVVTEEFDTFNYVQVIPGVQEFDIGPGNYIAGVSVEFVNRKVLGSVSFQKLVIDPQSNPIPDDSTVFTLHVESANGYSNDVDISASGGVVTLTDLPAGLYFVTEYNNPDYVNFIPGPTPFSFSIDPGNYNLPPIVLPVLNQKVLGSVVIQKAMENMDSNPATFTVHITGDNGYSADAEIGVGLAPASFFDLPIGHYTISEDAEYGYETVSIDPSSFDIGKGNYHTAVVVNVVNRKLYGSALFGKVVDNFDNDPAVFMLYVTGDNGYSNVVPVGETIPSFGLADLPFGHYTVSENPVVGYSEIDISPREFDIGPGNYNGDPASVTVTATNRKQLGSASFTKQVDNVDGDATEFTLYIDSINGYHNTVTVGELLPAAVLNDLPLGHYTVTEAGTTGYALIGITPSEFDVTAENHDTTVHALAVVNRKLYGSASFGKEVDNVTDDPAVFTLRIAGPGGYGNTVTVGETGAAVTLVDLPFGHYTVSEDAMDGYEEVGIEPREFDIGEGNYGETPSVSVQAVNRKLYGSAQFTKQVDNVDNDATEFTLTITGNNGYANTVTVGELLPAAVLNDLPLGHYTVAEAGTTGYELVSITPSEFDVTPENHTVVTAVAVVNHKLLGSASFAKSVDNVSGDLTEFTLNVDGVDNGYHNTVRVGGLITGSSLWDLPFGHYVVTEAATPGYRNVSITPSEFDINETNYLPEHEYMTSVSVHATNHKLLGWIQVIKKDANDETKFLEGAEFQVSTAGGEDFEANIVETITTGADGAATTSALPEGTYYVRESKAPEGYVIDDGSIHAATVADGETFVVSPAFTDTKYEGWIAVTKLDAQTRLPVAGVVFQLLDRNPNTDPGFTVLDEQTTGEDGRAMFLHLVPGVTYYVREIRQAPGYDINVSDVHEVIVIFNDEAPTQFENNEIGRLTVAKEDSRDGSPLEGAVFQISSSLEDFDNHIVETLTTGPDGTATSGDLIVGTYWVKEVTAPAGYLIDNPDPVEVTVPFNDTLTVGPFTDTRNLGAVVILKVDALNPDKPLAGAEFALFTDFELTNQVGDSVITGADGIARFDDLEPGTYWIMELAAPKDYDLMTAPLDVVVTGGVFEPDPIIITDQYNPPKDYETGTMSWSFLLLGFLALLAGAMLVLFTRKRRTHIR